jgi:hypothetical protein
MQNCHSRQKERQKEYSVAHVYRAIKYTFAHVINVYQVHWVVVYMYICIYTYVYIYIQICHPLTTATRPPSAAPPRRTMLVAVVSKLALTPATRARRVRTPRTAHTPTTHTVVGRSPIIVGAPTCRVWGWQLPWHLPNVASLAVRDAPVAQ